MEPFPRDDWEFNVLGIYNFRKPGKLTNYFQFIRENHMRMKGGICEVGVYRGSSLLAAAMLLKEAGSDKKVYGFDSFQGFPGYHENDDLARFEDLYKAGRIHAAHFEAVQRNKTYKALSGAQNLTAKNISSSGDFSMTSLEVLESKIRFFGLDNIELIKGPFEETMRAESFSDHKYMAALMDCDLYESHRIALPFVWRLLSPGGYLFLDEYYSLKFPGARMACDKFFANLPEKPLMHNKESGDFERWYAVKQES